jgi:hypothetical protein
MALWGFTISALFASELRLRDAQGEKAGRADLPHPAFGQGCYFAFAHGRLV